MKNFTSALAVGLIASSLSLSAFALDAAKPVVANTKAKSTVSTKKDSGIKTAVKKLAPSAKKTDLKIK